MCIRDRSGLEMGARARLEMRASPDALACLEMQASRDGGAVSSRPRLETRWARLETWSSS
eukprot:151725-Prymnesium_polylepis.1